LGSDEPPSGLVWWLKTLELHGCIKVVRDIFRDCTTVVQNLTWQHEHIES